MLQVTVLSYLSPFCTSFIVPLDYCMAQTLTHYSSCKTHCLCVNITHCLLHVNGLLTMYGVMRPWVQGQLWYMRLKIGLCCTDDLISIFRDLGMEMTLFTFKCFVLAPGFLYLCLIPVHRPNHTLHRVHWLVWTYRMTTIHCGHPTTARQRAQREHSTPSRSHLHRLRSAGLMHAFKKLKQTPIPKGLCLQR